MKINNEILHKVAIKTNNQTENDAALLFFSKISGTDIPKSYLPDGRSYEYDADTSLVGFFEECTEVQVFEDAGPGMKVYDFSKIHKLMTDIIEESSVKVQLNDEYTAEIQNGTVKVGCQTISFEKVLELAKEVEKAKKK